MTEKLIYESKNSKIYFLPDSEWGQPVIKKVLNYEFPTPVDIDRFYNEFEVIDGYELQGTRKALRRTKVKNRHAIFLEWFDGSTLTEAFRGKQGDIIDFLHIAIAMADALAEIHRHQIIHKDLNPSNILVNLQQRKVKIIDFGISTKIDLKEYHLGNPAQLEGTLAYSSPEQTGRMNRVVDYRTDLYSLGVTLYQILTGRLPFEATDPVELVHCHIALTPLAPHEIDRRVPEMLSAVIEKLLAKNAEDRYQSAHGLKTDLEKCLKAFEESGTIPSFPIAQQDFSGKFSIPQKLYGREKETEAILQAFDRCAGGDLSTVLVAGYSGTGKSALVREVHKPITARKGYFIEGKFDQFLRSEPYYALLQAFIDLVDILLTEDEEKLTTLRQQILQALGQEGRVLTDVIPNLAFVIGQQPEVPELGGEESQNRFHYMMRKFLRTISTASHPVVLFIDDLQWADSASLSLLKTLMTDPDNGYLLCIGAYRDNEVSPAHPLITTVKEMQDNGARIETITIGNLSETNVSQLIADAIGDAPAAPRVRQLTRLVYAKTNGNAFFVTQFLRSLYEDGLLTFDYDKTQWTWGLSKIEEKNITDNVVELMAGKIRRLKATTQEALTLAACVGNIFDLPTLSVILRQPAEEVKQQLQEALKEGLIIPSGDKKYKFSHDRIQQAVNSLIPEEKKNQIHLNTGRLLLNNTDGEKREERIFDIVNQLNFGISLLEQEAERELLADLNLQAGRKAKHNSAFQHSFDYLQTGIGLLRDDCWQSQYELCLQLHSEATEAAYLCGDFTKMDELYRRLLGNATNILEKVKPYEIRILAYKAENKLLEAIETGLEVLDQLGERIPRKPNMVQVLSDFAYTAFLLRGKDNEYLAALPEMTDPYKIAAMRIIADITSSVYWASPNLLLIIVFRMIRLSLKYGNTAVSAFGYGSYGVILCGVLGFMKKGYDYGKLGLILLDKFNAKEWRAQIYVTIYALIIYWVEHIRNTLPPLQESFHIGMETGAIEFACVNTNIYCIHSFLCGRPLVRLEEETRAYSQSFRQLKQETNVNYNEVYRQAMLNFMGKSANPAILTGDAYDEEKMMVQNLERNDKTGTFFIHFNKLILCYHFGQPEKARYHAGEARKLLEAVLAKFEVPNHHFYEALNLLLLLPGAAGRTRRRYSSRVRKNEKQMRKWAKYAPENYRHKYLLIKAERQRVLGRADAARLLYDQAIAAASESEYTHEAALGYELAGRFYLELQSEDLAEYYLKAAYNTYREWGAKAKLRQLEQSYPKFISRVVQPGATLDSGSFAVNLTTTGVHGSFLDISTVLKAATTISGEMHLTKLLAVLMEIVVENAGAQRGMLLLEEDGKLFIEARHEEGGEVHSVLQHIPAEQSHLLSETVVQFVRRTGENIIIQDAGSDMRYKSDPYIREHSPRSILCLPIVNQGKFIGVLYLENNLTTGAFTQDRIHLLSLLSGQIAVSIDNAILYEKLEQKVEERTAQLAEEKQKSDELLYNILPRETAEELKRAGSTQPRRFENVSVLFSDVEGFTRIATRMSPEELVSAVNSCFSAFDEIVARYGLEKIKTIGDSYMCVGGLPIPSSTHAEDAVKAALAMQAWMQQFNKEQLEKGLPAFRIRIGIHTGPVVAGVVGTKKFAYDIWGDTVNTASRMESSGEAGKINISQDTFELVKQRYSCTPRGKIAAKNKGEIKMFFVEEIVEPKPDKDGYKTPGSPNHGKAPHRADL